MKISQHIHDTLKNAVFDFARITQSVFDRAEPFISVRNNQLIWAHSNLMLDSFNYILGLIEEPDCNTVKTRINKVKLKEIYTAFEIGLNLTIKDVIELSIYLNNNNALNNTKEITLAAKEFKKQMKRLKGEIFKNV